jgi:hypothetical protein
MMSYYTHMKNLGLLYTGYVAEALGLAPDAFEPLFESDVAKRQFRCKLLKYPLVEGGVVGFPAHTDSNFISYVSAPNIIGSTTLMLLCFASCCRRPMSPDLRFRSLPGSGSSLRPSEGRS